MSVAHRVLAVANEKGGVGKTTTAVNLSAALAELGRCVLLVDLDPAAAASGWLDARGDGTALRDVLDGRVELARTIVKTGVEHLDLIPAGRELLGFDQRSPGAEMVVRRRLDRLTGSWDLVVLDTAPGLSVLSVAALAAASEVLVPVDASALGLEGLANLMQTVALVRDRLNPKLCRERILTVRVDRRTRLAGEVIDHLRKRFGRGVCKTEIRINTKLAEAPSYARPITVYAPSSPGAEDYRALAREVERWRN